MTPVLHTLHLEVTRARTGTTPLPLLTATIQMATVVAVLPPHHPTQKAAAEAAGDTHSPVATTEMGVDMGITTTTVDLHAHAGRIPLLA